MADGEAIANGLCYAFARYARFLIDFGMIYLIESPFFKDYQGRYYFPSDPVIPGTDAAQMLPERNEEQGHNCGNRRLKTEMNGLPASTQRWKKTGRMTS